MPEDIRHPRDLLRVAAKQLTARGEGPHAGAELSFDSDRQAARYDTTAYMRLGNMLDRARDEYHWIRNDPHSMGESFLLTERGEQEMLRLAAFEQALASATAHFTSLIVARDREYSPVFRDEQAAMSSRGMPFSGPAQVKATQSLDNELELRRRRATELVISIGRRLGRLPDDGEMSRIEAVGVALVRQAVASLEPFRVQFNRPRHAFPRMQLPPASESEALDALRAELAVADFGAAAPVTERVSTHNTISVEGNAGAIVQGDGNTVRVAMRVNSDAVLTNITAVLEAITSSATQSAEIAELKQDLEEIRADFLAGRQPVRGLTRVYRGLVSTLSLAADGITVLGGTHAALPLVKAGLKLVGFELPDQ